MAMEVTDSKQLHKQVLPLVLTMAAIVIGIAILSNRSGSPTHNALMTNTGQNETASQVDLSGTQKVAQSYFDSYKAK